MTPWSSGGLTGVVAHKHPEVTAWLAKNPIVTLHSTPPGCSWLNIAEVFFSIITRRAIRRGTFTSVKHLIAKIGAFIDGWNDCCQPFVWPSPPTNYSPESNGKKLPARDTSLQATSAAP